MELQCVTFAREHSRTQTCNVEPATGTGQAGWIHAAKLAFFVALGYLRFVGEATLVQPA